MKLGGEPKLPVCTRYMDPSDETGVMGGSWQKTRVANALSASVLSWANLFVGFSD